MQTYLNCYVTYSTRARTRPTAPAPAPRSLFGYQMRFDLAQGFPLLTTKKLHLRSIIHELLWFIRGDSNIAYLKENGVTHLGRVGR